MMKQPLILLALSCCVHITTAQMHLEFLGLENQQLTDLDINYGLIAVGSDRNGVYWQFEGGATETGWAHNALDSSVSAVYPHKSGPIGWAITAGIQPASGEGPYLFCSMNGENFEIKSDGILPSETFGISDIDGFPDPSICGETFAAGGRILYRRNYGDTVWVPVFNATIEGDVQTVKVRQSYPGLVLLGGADGFAGRLLAKSIDFGDTWVDLSAPGAIAAIEFTGASADTIFVLSGDSVFRTLDGGLNWTTVLHEGLELFLRDVLYDAESNILFAAGGSSPDGTALLMISRDLGESWESISFDDIGTILGLESGSDGWVYFNTREDGVYRFREGTSDVKDIGDFLKFNISLKQNFPNPFSGSTQIHYEIGAPSQVIVSILNNTGTHVSTILNERQAAGKHSLTWNASDLPDGVYLIVLSALEQSVAKEAVVVGSQ